MNNAASFLNALRRLFAGLTHTYVLKPHDARKDKIKPEDGTPVGNLDFLAMEKLRELIEEKFPGETTIGEEDKRDPAEMQKLLGSDEYQWTIDGLDGTGNRGMRTLSFGAMVARRKGSEILFAAIFRPMDEIVRGGGFFYAEHGKGSWQWCGGHCDFHRIRAAGHGELERITVMLEGSSKKFFKPPISTLGLELTTRPGFSCSIAATTVAMGAASALVTIDHAPWDDWPASCIIKEAGGIVTDWQGNSWTPSCKNMVAAGNREDHAVILEILNRNNK